MRPQIIASLLSAAAVGRVAADTGELGDATVVKNNPPAPIWKAELPADAFFTAGSLEGNVKGSILAAGTLSGEGVQFKVHFENLPKEGGPFTYHLHVAPVPENGNCTATLAHHDPFIRGEATPCDKDKPATCQVGDLSGKYGAITSDPYDITYTDPYASLVEGLGSYFGNRSFVFHFANKTRISCANFVPVAGTGSVAPATPTTDSCNSTVHSSGSPAGAATASLGLLAAGVAAVVFTL